MCGLAVFSLQTMRTLEFASDALHRAGGALRSVLIVSGVVNG